MPLVDNDSSADSDSDDDIMLAEHILGNLHISYSEFLL